MIKRTMACGDMVTLELLPDNKGIAFSVVVDFSQVWLGIRFYWLSLSLHLGPVRVTLSYQERSLADMLAILETRSHERTDRER